MLQLLADVPNLFIRYLVDLIPHLHIRLVVDVTGAKGLLVEALPQTVAPRGQMHTIGNITDVVFFGEIARPQRLEHLPRHAAVNLTYAVHLLAEVGGQHTNRELLVRVVRVEAALAHEAFPTDIHAVSIVRHIGTDEMLLKSIVTCWHRRVSCEQGRCPNQLKRDIKVKVVLVDIHAQTF